MSTNKTTTPSTLIQPYLFFGGRCEEALEFYRVSAGRTGRHAHEAQGQPRTTSARHAPAGL